MSSRELVDPATATAPPRVSSQDRLLELIRKKRPDYHPVLAMVDLAHEITDDPTLQFQCHKEVARYVVAVDKFVEVKTEVKQTRRVLVELFAGKDHPATQERALEDATPQGVTDVIAKEVRGPVAAVTGEAGDTETTVVRTRASVDLHDAWGDGSTGAAAGRFA